MKQIKVLGTGCAKCVKTADFIQKIVNDKEFEAEVIKETDLAVIMGYGVMSTPAVVVDEQVVHTGSIPTKEKVESWLK